MTVGVGVRVEAVDLVGESKYREGQGAPIKGGALHRNHTQEARRELELL